MVENVQLAKYLCIQITGITLTVQEFPKVRTYQSQHFNRPLYLHS